MSSERRESTVERKRSGSGVEAVTPHFTAEDLETFNPRATIQIPVSDTIAFLLSSLFIIRCFAFIVEEDHDESEDRYAYY
jgi:hypothetical protein